MSFHYIFERRFSMAHRLISGTSEKCALPHGHNEYVQVSLAPLQSQCMAPGTNVIRLFEDLKQKWHHFIDYHLDHALQLSASDPLLTYFQEKEPERLSRIVITPGDPTTEIMCACLMSKLQTFLDVEGEFQCVALRLQETPTNTVLLEGFQAYLTYLPYSTNHWWSRPDHSINDFPSHNEGTFSPS